MCEKEQSMEVLQHENVLLRQRLVAIQHLLETRQHLTQGAERLPYKHILFKQILNNAPVFVVVRDVQGRFIFINQRAAAALQMHEQQRIDRSVYDLSMQAFAEPWSTSDALQLRNGTSVEEEEVVQLTDGLHTFLSLKFPICNEQGTPQMVATISTDITERKRMEETLRESEEKYRMLFSNASDALALLEIETLRFLDVNPSWMQLYGYSYEEALTMAAPDVSTEPDATSATMQQAAHRGSVSIALQWHHSRDGRVFPIEFSAGTFSWNGQTLICTFAREITERRQMELELRAANEQLMRSLRYVEQRNRDTALINGMSDFLQDCLTFKHAYQVIAQVAEQLFAHQPGALYSVNLLENRVEAVATWGMPAPAEHEFTLDSCLALKRGQVRIFEPFCQGPFCQHVEVPNTFASACIPLIAQGEPVGMLHLRSTHLHAPEVQERWEWLAMMLADRLALALANLQLRQRLRVQAVRDSLTGLFNRRYLDETLERELQRAERYNHSVGIIILDIDHFKAFNTIHGLRGGDATLRAVGTFLQSHTRSGDVACRFGGEEFTLVLPHASLDDTYRRAEELRESIKHLQVEYEGRTLQTITVSLGVSCFPSHGTTVESVIAAADYALGIAKASGRDRVVIAELPT